ncbi:segregation and condensation protein A [Candidatus Soleaferrea massiliensis]|uniref:segregation and condensation protein A n=1 Tax=Candidatus Soleaferrea massiliensis TaxID=1470354 RepID=UPI00058E6795|nr:segregation/condensation protein A [Candidatus Soleaferrea massiliensis]
MEKLSFKLEQFEGPLDLLLHLIAKHKLDIYDIEIAKLLEQYLLYLDGIQLQDIEIASEFIEMAARLVYIKTVSLLPKHEEEERLRQELTGQLLEYQVCKQVAAELAARNVGYDIFTKEPDELEVDTIYQLRHNPNEIFSAYLNTLGKHRQKLPVSPKVFSPLVSRRVISVRSRIIYILRRLYGNEFLTYHGLFEQSQERSELVATFLAVLELIKSGRILMSGETDAIRLNMKEPRPLDGLDEIDEMDA